MTNAVIWLRNSNDVYRRHVERQKEKRHVITCFFHDLLFILERGIDHHHHCCVKEVIRVILEMSRRKT